MLIKGNPGRRRAPEPIPAEKPKDPLDPPEGLGERGAAAWVRYWAGGRAWLSLADYEGIRRLCRLIDYAAAVEAKVDTEGFMVLNGRTKRSAIHHSFNTVLGLYKAIADLESAHGFPATERGRLRPSANTGDEIDRWKSGAGS